MKHYSLEFVNNERKNLEMIISYTYYHTEKD